MAEVRDVREVDTAVHQWGLKIEPYDYTRARGIWLRWRKVLARNGNLSERDLGAREVDGCEVQDVLRVCFERLNFLLAHEKVPYLEAARLRVRQALDIMEGGIKSA